MKHLSSIYDLLLESIESYEFQLLSDDPMLFKYSFIDVVGNKYLVELKNTPVGKVGILSNIYELVYFVEDKGEYSVSKIVNVNPYRVLQTVFGDILNDFISRCSWAKTIYFIGLSKDRERDYVSSRTKVYYRYLQNNPIDGWEIDRYSNEIYLNKI